MLYNRWSMTMTPRLQVISAEEIDRLFSRRPCRNQSFRPKFSR